MLTSKTLMMQYQFPFSIQTKLRSPYKQANHLKLSDPMFFNRVRGDGRPAVVLPLVGSTRLQPTCDTQSRLVGEQHFVLQFAAFEKHTFAIEGRDRLDIVAVVDAEFAAVFFLPVAVQVHDHGNGPVLVVAKLVQVPFVKGTFFVQSVMKFVAGDASVAASVQVDHKTIHEVEKIIFMRIVVGPVKPVDQITPHPFILHQRCVIANARRMQTVVCKEGV